MNRLPWKDRIHRFPAALWSVRTRAGAVESIEEPARFQLADASGQWSAVSWLPEIAGHAGDAMQTGVATTIDVRNHPSDPLAITAWEPDPNLDILELIPSSACPVPDVVAQVRDMVRNLHSPLLRDFMRSVFSLPDVFRYYWTCPASLAHHHAKAGGLALHSLEVAVTAGNWTELSTWEHDVVVTHALLHDLGKIWSYDEGCLSAEARQFGHERLGLERIRPQLETFAALDPVMGRRVFDLLLGEWKKSCKHPAAGLGNIVRAMDQFTVDRHMQRRADEVAGATVQKADGPTVW